MLEHEKRISPDLDHSTYILNILFISENLWVDVKPNFTTSNISYGTDITVQSEWASSLLLVITKTEMLVFLTNHSGPFFFIFVFSFLMYNWWIKFWWCWDLNRWSLVSETTTLPTEPPPLPYQNAWLRCLHWSHQSISEKSTWCCWCRWCYRCSRQLLYSNEKNLELFPAETFSELSNF